MRRICLLLILFIIIGCSGDPVSSIDPQFFVGTWTGTSSATYPDPVDENESITSEELIKFRFRDSTFLYYWTDGAGGDTIPYGSGDYVIGDSTVTFSNVLLSGYYQPMDLQGEFEFGLVDSTLSLVQNPVLFFQTYHLVTLEKEEAITD